ncbi:MAG: redoxin domain-containing protein [Candidatus Latescibacteria bacterium]|nr:redoxin domain-containing protein [Candidatus Latescibacterota bacterium]
MRPLKRTISILASLAFALLAGTGTTVSLAQPPSPPAQMEDNPQAQMKALQDAINVPGPQERVTQLEQFLAKYPDTPFKANAYWILFKSYGEFSQDHEKLWALGQKTIEAGRLQAETMLPPFQRNPALAEMYNGIAYGLADYGIHLDEALDYAQQARSLIEQAVPMRPPMMPNEQWLEEMSLMRGQILDTIGWVQFKRNVLPDAEKAIAEAVVLLPDNGTLRYHLGRVYAAEGQAEKAIGAHLDAVTVTQPDSSSQAELEKLYKTRYGAASRSKLTADLAAARARAQAAQKVKLLAERLNTPAPDFEVETLTGEKVKLSSLKGKVVVVNFWATWCAPCREEMPKLQQTYEAYRGKDVAFLVASVDRERENVKPYIDENRYTFPVYYAGPSAELYQVDFIPTTFIIDKQGMIQFKHTSYRPDIRDVLGWQIDALLTGGR